MAYYEMMPAGLPAGLQSGMDSVLNKKFGTATTYAPEDWPDTVNLMGPLPEKTIVSSPIANFNDGADDVPTKSLVVTIAPTLDGVSTITETQTGRNLLDTAIAETKSNNSVSITCDGNGKYTATGTATGGSANVTFTLKTPCTIKSGMYLHLMNASANASVSITFQKQDNTTIYAPALSPANRIADLSSYAGQTIYSIRFYVANGASFEMSLTPMICFSSTTTAYEPFTAPTTYTAQLGRTVYGGTADLVNGVGQETYGYLEIDDNAPWVNVGGSYPFAFQLDTGVLTADQTQSASTSNICNQYTFTTVSVPQTNAIRWQFTSTPNGRIYVYNYDYSGDLQGFLNSLHNNPLKIAFKLATPTDFTFTGQDIPTMLGYNAFWSDQGDTEVTYRADINLALGGN